MSSVENRTQSAQYVTGKCEMPRLNKQTEKPYFLRNKKSGVKLNGMSSIIFWEIEESRKSKKNLVKPYFLEKKSDNLNGM